MRTVDAIAEILKREGIDHLICFPTTPLIEAVAEAGIRPIVCRQERVGVGIADGYARVKNGRPPGVFAMQSGPGAENAFAGIATAFSDATPMLVLPLGQPRIDEGVFPLFSSVRTYASVTKSVEYVTVPEKVVDAMRRAFALQKMGRPGPVLVEIPSDLAGAEVVSELLGGYRPVERAVSQGSPADIDRCARALLQAARPVILAGSEVL